MKDHLIDLINEALKNIEKAASSDELNDIRVAFLGKKGSITSIMKEMKGLKPEERPAFGQMVNEAKTKVESALEEAKRGLENDVLISGLSLKL